MKRSEAIVNAMLAKAIKGDVNIAFTLRVRSRDKAFEASANDANKAALSPF